MNLNNAHKNMIIMRNLKILEAFNRVESIKKEKNWKKRELRLIRI
jgi:hypothetical protein